MREMGTVDLLTREKEIESPTYRRRPEAHDSGDFLPVRHDSGNPDSRK